MKASELMIGDWVQDITPCVIDAISNEDICTYRNVDGYITANPSNLKPIPLTAEILEKNGFECEQMEFWRAIWNTYKIALNLYIAICGDMRMCGYYVTQRNDSDYIHDMFKIDYVHQLQHALRLFGLNEMADNLKV